MYVKATAHFVIITDLIALDGANAKSWAVTQFAQRGSHDSGDQTLWHAMHSGFTCMHDIHGKTSY